MKLNIGCYKDIREGYINLDKKQYCDGVNIIHDLEVFPYPFKDNTFNEIIENIIVELKVIKD